MAFRDLIPSRRLRTLKRLEDATGSRENATRALEVLATYLEHDGSLYRLYEITGEAMTEWLDKPE